MKGASEFVLNMKGLLYTYVKTSSIRSRNKLCCRIGGKLILKLLALWTVLPIELEALCTAKNHVCRNGNIPYMLLYCISNCTINVSFARAHPANFWASGSLSSLKGSKPHQNGSFDFWTSCPNINYNPLPSLQSYISSSKYLYLVLWDLFINFFGVFVCIWINWCGNKKIKISTISRDWVPLKAMLFYHTGILAIRAREAREILQWRKWRAPPGCIVSWYNTNVFFMSSWSWATGWRKSVCKYISISLIRLIRPCSSVTKIIRADRFI